MNRFDEFGAVREHVRLLRQDATHFKVFEVVGMAGVGKTRFLNELRQGLDDGGQNNHLIWVSLAAEAATSAIGPLRVIRGQARFDCLLFDAAILSYWAATGQPMQSLKGRGQVAGLAMRSVELGGILAGVPLPLSFAADLYGAMDRAVARRRRYTRAEFEEIDDLRDDPTNLFRRLPHYLASDLGRRLQRSRTALVAFYDSYEKQASQTLEEGSPWLREFIATLGVGIHVITTRDRFVWDVAEWGQVVQPLIIGSLPVEECRSLISDALGQVDPAVIDHLLRASHRIPFFLEASIDVCKARLDEGQSLDVRDLPSTPDSAIEYMLDHLGPAERTIAIALGCLQFFDEPLYMFLVRSLNLPISVVEMRDFIQWFFIAPSEGDMFKTHQLLTDSVRNSVAHVRIKLEALQSATEHLASSVPADGAEEKDRSLILYHALLAAWQSYSEVPVDMVELLVDIGYVIYDAGYWQSLALLPVVSPGLAPHAAAGVALFFAALAARRSDGPAAAIERLEQVEPFRPLLGRHAASFDLEGSYLSEITGNYVRAREEFSSLNEAATPFDPTRRDHLRARLYHADMLIMDGRLVDASRLLIETSELVGPDALLDWAELVRHRGHAYRFSLMMDDAERVYLQALRASAGSLSLTGKLQTNLVESRCWTAPELAIKDLGTALSLNTDLRNPLEVAKCRAAEAIALARLGERRAAKAACERARQDFESLGYPAGVAFALQARVAVEALSGRAAAANMAYIALTRHVDSLGVYGHLALLAARVREDTTEFHRVAEQVQLIEPQTFEERLNELLAQPGS